jgi:hypothetical protein
MLGGVSSRDASRDERMTTSSAMVCMFARAQREASDEENREMHMVTQARRWTRADLEPEP